MRFLVEPRQCEHPTLECSKLFLKRASTTPSCFAIHPFINEGEVLGGGPPYPKQVLPENKSFVTIVPLCEKKRGHCNFPFIDEGVASQRLDGVVEINPPHPPSLRPCGYRERHQTLISPFAILQQHSDHLTQVIAQLVERLSLRVCARKTGDIADQKPSRIIPLNDSLKTHFHNVISISPKGTKRQVAKRHAYPTFFENA